jgi:hypothetical protein
MDATKSPTTQIPPELMADLQRVIERVMRGERDREDMRRACESMDRISEEIYRKHGVLDIGVPAIREFRDRE